MAEFRKRTEMSHPADELFAWHERPGAFQRLVAPWDDVVLLEGSDGVHDGTRTIFQLRRGPVRIRWEAVHRDHQPGRSFTDVQERGPFAAWSHTHRCEPVGEARSVLDDHIHYELPLGPLGRLFGGGSIRRTLDRMFAFRHRRTQLDLDRHAAMSGRDRLHVAITGSSGLVGSALVPFLTTGGHRVTRLVRREPGPGEAHWDPARGEIDRAALEGVDAVVHLAGHSIASRWTRSRKEAVLRSRVDGTRLIAQALAEVDGGPRVLVSASAIGFYGSGGEEWVDEDCASGQGFLAEVVREWEAAADAARRAGVRVVHPRIGMVVSGGGGALAKLLPAYLAGLGGPIGHGRQYMSWIALDDLLGALYLALHDDRLEGPVNAVAPAPVTNREFSRVLGRVLRRPAVLPLPAPVVRLAFGEMGREMLLEGVRVRPDRLVSAGLPFYFPELEAALRFELGRMG